MIDGFLLGAIVVVVIVALRNETRRRRAAAYDLSNPDNQLRFIEKGAIRAARPINREAYGAVFIVLERLFAVQKRRFRVLPEVTMGAFLRTPYEAEGPGERAAHDRAYRSINSKRVDFLIIDPRGAPALVVEYHGSGHFQGNAAARDAVKRRALEIAGVPLLEVFEGTPPDELRAAVADVLRLRT